MKNRKLKQQKRKRSKNQDWAYDFISFWTGCSNDCLYCYAKNDAVTKKRLNLVDWKNEKIRPHDFNKNYKLFNSPLMFPSSHDITNHNFVSCCTVLTKLLGVGNRVLIVSKPRFELITKICNDFIRYRNNIIFRFTIGSTNDNILSFWEPNAPSYDERKSALKYAYNSGYRTSVSIEPMLDADNIVELIDDLTPFVNHSIWIGLMSALWYLDTDEADVKTDAGRNRVARNKSHFGDVLAQKIKEEVQKIKKTQRPENLKRIYEKLKDKKIPGQNKLLIQWKSGIRDEIGLPRPEEPEQWPINSI